MTGGSSASLAQGPARRGHALLVSFLTTLAAFPLMLAGAGGDVAATDEASTASTVSFSVVGDANIFGAGHPVPPEPGGYGAGTLPPEFAFTASPGQEMTVTSVTGCVTMTVGTGYCDGGDGSRFFVLGTNITSYTGISGIAHDTNGFLTGVFLDPTEPMDPAPPVLDFRAAVRGTNFSTLSPVIGQTFFIGDGLTGTGVGTIQRFIVPPTATRLYLGFADAYEYQGPPGAYVDNGGFLNATVDLPSSGPVRVPITIDSAPTGVVIEIDRLSHTTPYVLQCVLGSVPTLNALSPQTAGASRYTFSNWSDGGAQSHTVTCTAPATYIANFATEFLMDVSSVPLGRQVTVDGSILTAPQSYWWLSGSSHSLDSPSPQMAGNTRYVFSSWSDGGPQSHTVVATAPTSITANFGTQFQVTIDTNPTRLTVVVDSAPFIAPFSAYWDADTAHTAMCLSPQSTGPGTQYVFFAWSDGDLSPSRTIIADSAKTLVCGFAAEYFLTMNANVGSVSPGSGWYGAGEVVAISATAPPGSGQDRYTFDGWTGDFSGTTPTGSILMDAPKAVVANWVHEYRIEVQSNVPSVEVLVDGVSATLPAVLWWAEGSAHTVTAPSEVAVSADTRWTFASWTPGTTDPTLTLAAIMGSGVYSASYARQFQFTIVTDPAGLRVRVDGAPYAAPRDFWWIEGTSHSLDGGPTQPGPAGARFVWRSWSDGGARAKSVSATGPTTITATFQPQFFLTVQSPHGSPTCSSPDCWYDEGALAGFTVPSRIAGSPGVRFVFTAWAGDSGATTPNAELSMDAPKTVTATWTTQYLLTVEAGIGEASSGGWYNAGSAAGFSVVRTDVYASGRHYRFAGWTGAVRTTSAVASATMTEPMTVTATWNEVSFIEADWWALPILIAVMLGLILLVLVWKRRKEEPEDEEDTSHRAKTPENVTQRRDRGA